jgi:hypothetical protein
LSPSPLAVSRRRARRRAARRLAMESLEARIVLSSFRSVVEIAPGAVIERYAMTAEEYERTNQTEFNRDESVSVNGSGVLNPNVPLNNTFGSPTVTFNPAGGTPANVVNGFIAAGALWANLLVDQVTVNINISFTALAPGVLGSALSMVVNQSYTQVRTALTNDRTSNDDFSAVAALQAGNSVSMLLNLTSNNPNGFGSLTPYLDNDGDANNTTLELTRANAKALGLVAANSPVVDAQITFSNLITWDFNPADGITPGAFDFVGVAAHEIGHALGFTSGVDMLDVVTFMTGPFPDNQWVFVSPLDLFRFSAQSFATGPGIIDWTADTRTKFFSINGGATAIANFSTGENFGDGRQASHWQDNMGIGLMGPTFAPGALGVISATDLRAFDVIGWNLRVFEDYGDAPSPYPTLLANNGARHTVGSVFLGALVGPDYNGQPNATATGDDMNGIDDEDGVIFPNPFVANTSVDIQVTSSPGGGVLDFFIDWDQNGVWGNAANEVYSVNLAGGSETVSVAVPLSAALGTTFARFRISTAGGLGPTGLAATGEVEDYRVTVFGVPPPLDFGDAPTSYGTTTPTGARHAIGGPRLGATVDDETNGFPSVAADGDDLDNTDDEDGVTFPNPIVRGATSNIQVNSTGGQLDYFFDFDRNGVFGNNPNEVFSIALAPGTQTVPVVVPSTALLGSTYARFRISTAGGLGPTGLALDGEVEDYVVNILPVGTGTIGGVVYHDLGADGVRSPGDPNVPNVHIFLDLDNNGLPGLNEPAGVSDANGRYRIFDVDPGTYTVRQVMTPGWVQTGPTPVPPGTYTVAVSAAVDILNLHFGNTANFDWGDAPNSYRTLAASNGASHAIISGYHLGASIDGEGNGQPNATATGDDAASLADEDGVAFSVLVRGNNATATVFLTQNAGRLAALPPQGRFHLWIDWNGDGDFNDSGEQVIKSRKLNRGSNVLTFKVPSNAVPGTTFARARLSIEKNMGSFGPSKGGEVEDYAVLVMGTTDLGTVDSRELPPPLGDTIYKFKPARSGPFTVEAFFAHNQGNIDLALFDSNNKLVAASSSTTDNERLDFKAESGKTYYLNVRGANPHVGLKLTNLLGLSGKTLTVYGTGGDDAFTFHAAATHALSVNGTTYSYASSAVNSVKFQGNGGNDSLVVHGTSGDETATLHPGTADVAGSNYRVQAASVETITVVSNGGRDVANLFGSTGSDEFHVAGGSSTLKGNKFHNSVEGYDQVYADTAGGSDSAYLYDSVGDDLVAIHRNGFSLTTSTTRYEAKSFEKLYATGGQGNDRVDFADVADADTFYGRESLALHSGSGFRNEVAGYQHVTATSRTGNSPTADVDNLDYLFEQFGDWN